MSEKKESVACSVEEADELHEPEVADQEVPGVPNKWDENTGAPLDPVLVAKGRQKELDKLKSMKVYDVISRDEAMQDKSAKLVKTRWVEVQKQDEVRSRFVAQEIAAGDPRDDLYAGTPPLTAARLLLSRAAVIRDRPWRVQVLDVTCAFLNAACLRSIGP